MNTLLIPLCDFIIMPQMSMKEWLGIDKIQKLAKIVKEMGGIKAVAKKRYL